MFRSIYNIFLFISIAAFATNAHAIPKLFNKSETISTGIGEFPKWVEALNKNMREQNQYLEACTNQRKPFYCNIANWHDTLKTMKDKSLPEKLKAVNDFGNKHPYIIDQDNWGMSDYWESPGEFLFRNGDCEDYAIIKYMSLKFLGVSPDNMRIIILYDSNINAHHSVLAVYDKDDIFILDNQITSVIRDKKIYHYIPIFSLNEEHWWRYM